MALSVQRELHIDTHLTDMAINYAPQAFIADQIAPIVPVNKESDSYAIFSRFEKYATDDTTRSRGTEAKKVTRSVSSSNYSAKNYALGYDVAIEDLANMDQAFRGELDLGAAQYLVEKLGLDYEKRVLTLAGLSASVGTTFVPSSSWSVAGSNAGDPFSAMMQAAEQMKSMTGQAPNSALIGWRAWNFIRRNYQMRNLINGVNNGKGSLTRQQVQNELELDRFIVSDAMYHTANEAAVNSGVFTNPIHDKVFLYYAPLAVSRNAPSWMYSFRWTPAGYPAPMVVERHPYDSRKKIETIEAGYFQDEKITGSDYAVCIAGVGSAQANGLT